jgi:hypothetical protein
MRVLARIIGLALLLRCAIAHADDEEKRLALGLVGIAAEVHYAASAATSAGAGLAFSLGYGLSNDLDLDVSAAVATLGTCRLPDALIDGIVGTLYVDVIRAQLDLELRLRPGVSWSRWFARTRPIAAVGIGLVGDWFRDALLVSDSELEIPLEDRLRWRVEPTAGATLGIEHRVGQSVLLGADLEASFGWSGSRAVSLIVRAALLWY